MDDKTLISMAKCDLFVQTEAMIATSIYDEKQHKLKMCLSDSKPLADVMDYVHNETVDKSDVVDIQERLIKMQEKLENSETLESEENSIALEKIKFARSILDKLITDNTDAVPYICTEVFKYRERDTDGNVITEFKIMPGDIWYRIEFYYDNREICLFNDETTELIYVSESLLEENFVILEEDENRRGGNR